jgi:hypothetical protein
MTADVELKSEDRGHRRRRPLTWLGLLALGWVRYELTTRPEVGAVAVCAKFGWEDFRAAIWLRRRDPWPYRGRACFWLYLASGLLKTAGVAFLMTIGFAAIGSWAAGAGPGAALEQALVSTVLANLVSLAFAGLTLAYALGLAWHHRIMLWLSPVAHRARRRDAWPPGSSGLAGDNRLQGAVLIALLVLGPPLSLVPVLLVMVFIALPVGPLIDSLNNPFSLAWVIGLGVCILKSREWVAKHLLAGHPGECWGRPAPGNPEGMAEGPGRPLP